MSRRLTLGSLFDGSGGFPLAGLLHGIIPVWASEIEPYPLRVTAKRLPCMEQHGDVANIDGGSITPVDIITFGSPCQDLSVAGKRAGIHEGERSNLFFHAIRIIREMRKATGGTYPRFALWENVPGAFSSNAGEDFRSVLQSFIDIGQEAASNGKDETELVLLGKPEKWSKAGEIVGNGYSIAWRTLDAQYWGVPQRRRRIYLVADFGSERAGKILFEREGVCRDNPTRGDAREGTAADAQGGAGGSGCVRCLNPWDTQTIRQYDTDGVCPSLQDMTIAYPCAAFMGGQGSKAGGLGYRDEISPTLKSVLSGGNTVPDVVYAVQQNADGDTWLNDTPGAISTNCNASGRNTPICVYCLQGNGIGRDDKAGCDGRGWREEKCYTLDTADRHAVAYDARGNGDGEITPALIGDHENRVTDYTTVVAFDRAAYNQGENAKYNPAIDDSGIASTVVAKGPGGVCLNCAKNQKPPRRYIVRRLTPLECCRLQGFPDWWEDGAEGSDSARYKMWGNGIALPCAAFVLGGIAKVGAYGE